MIKSSYHIVKHPLVTEKGNEQSGETNTYPFRVDVRANKIEIKRAVEELYGVKVRRVRTLMMHGKKRRYRWSVGRTSDWKKAYVTLHEGEHIDLI